MKRWVVGMRDAFSQTLYDIAQKDPNFIMVTSDTGAICHDEFRKNCPNQYINVGIAEQNMVGMASGLALSGKTACVYAIVPFSTMRCYEQIRVDLCCMNLPVMVIGVGAGFDYSTLGPTHHGTEDIALMRALPDMAVYSPADSLMADLIARECYAAPGPKYIRLDRTGYPLLYPEGSKPDISKGMCSLKEGKDLTIIATGRMSVMAMEVAADLEERTGAKVGVVDLFRIKPLDAEYLCELIKNTSSIVTLEEHFVSGGMGSAVAEALAEKENTPKHLIYGIPDRFCRVYGKREHLLRDMSLDRNSVTDKLEAWLKK